jgi:hypothetical protein
MKKQRPGVEIELVVPPEPVVTTTESTAAYLKRMAAAARAMEKRYGK